MGFLRGGGGGSVNGKDCSEDISESVFEGGGGGSVNGTDCSEDISKSVFEWGGGSVNGKYCSEDISESHVGMFTVRFIIQTNGPA